VQEENNQIGGDDQERECRSGIGCKSGHQCELANGEGLSRNALSQRRKTKVDHGAKRKILTGMIGKLSRGDGCNCTMRP